MIGEGSYSIVFKGYSEDTNETVAIKIVKLSIMRDQSVYKMIEQEINAMKQLDHPNIVKLYEVLSD